LKNKNLLPQLSQPPFIDAQSLKYKKKPKNYRLEANGWVEKINQFLLDLLKNQYYNW